MSAPAQAVLDAALAVVEAQAVQNAARADMLAKDATANDLVAAEQAAVDVAAAAFQTALDGAYATVGYGAARDAFQLSDQDLSAKTEALKAVLLDYQA